MTRNVFSFAGVAGLFIAVALLAGCYAPLANQDGYLSLNLSGARFGGATSQVIVLVVNSDSGNAFKETLSLISKAYYASGSFTSSDVDRLTTLAKQLATSGLVKFGGFPFYQTTISGTSGTFKIPGIPAGRDYFVKLFVFQPGFSFKVENIDKNFAGLLQAENKVFSAENYLTAWQTWTPQPGQQVSVSAGQSVALTAHLDGTPTIPY